MESTTMRGATRSERYRCSSKRAWRSSADLPPEDSSRTARVSPQAPAASSCARDADNAGPKLPRDDVHNDVRKRPVFRGRTLYKWVMHLDAENCYRAFSSRDRRFEGRFVAAVTTTGVYCRPGCPAPPPRRGNLRFYSCPAAAEEAG